MFSVLPHFLRFLTIKWYCSIFLLLSHSQFSPSGKLSSGPPFLGMTLWKGSRDFLVMTVPSFLHSPIPRALPFLGLTFWNCSVNSFILSFSFLNGCVIILLLHFLLFFLFFCPTFSHWPLSSLPSDLPFIPIFCTSAPCLLFYLNYIIQTVFFNRALIRILPLHYGREQPRI